MLYEVITEVGVGSGGNFTSDEGHAGGDQGFAGHACIGILTDDCIQDGIGNLVSYNFV